MVRLPICVERAASGPWQPATRPDAVCRDHPGPSTEKGDAVRLLMTTLPFKAHAYTRVSSAGSRPACTVRPMPDRCMGPDMVGRMRERYLEAIQARPSLLRGTR